MMLILLLLPFLCRCSEEVNVPISTQLVNPELSPTADSAFPAANGNSTILPMKGESNFFSTGNNSAIVNLFTTLFMDLPLAILKFILSFVAVAFKDYGFKMVALCSLAILGYAFYYYHIGPEQLESEGEIASHNSKVMKLKAMNDDHELFMKDKEIYELYTSIRDPIEHSTPEDAKGR